jgi:hypothetical protein
LKQGAAVGRIGLRAVSVPEMWGMDGGSACSLQQKQSGARTGCLEHALAARVTCVPPALLSAALDAAGLVPTPQQPLSAENADADAHVHEAALDACLAGLRAAAAAPWARMSRIGSFALTTGQHELALAGVVAL